jgi:hypothetical protein
MIENSMLVEGGAESFDSWGFALRTEQPDVLAFNESVAWINLSRLGVDCLDGWDVILAERLLVATSALMGWAPYHQDFGVSSWRTVSEADRYAAVFWRLLVWPLGWLGLRRIDDTQVSAAEEVTPARRLVRFASAGLERGQGKLFVRPGNVELWAMWSALIDLPGAQAAAERVAHRAFLAAEAGEDLVAKYDRPWTDADRNIARLNTNAGWYAKPGRGTSAFSDWADRYAAALCRGQLLAAHMIELLPTAAALLPEFRTKRPLASTELGFLKLLDQAKIVFVTVFAQEIQQHYVSGGLGALWKELGVDQTIRALQTVPAPMSVWPYYPHNCWKDTFECLLRKTAQAIEALDATVLIASCGAYGLPLVDEMHRRFGITCYYFGHQTNMFFGVATAATLHETFYKRNPNSNHWITPNISHRFPRVASIDDGRYMAIVKKTEQ